MNDADVDVADVVINTQTVDASDVNVDIVDAENTTCSGLDNSKLTSDDVLSADDV